MIGYAMDLALLTALRQGDILRIERRHLTDDGLVVETSKTGRALLFEWSSELRATTHAALKEAPQLRRSVVCRRDGKPMTSSGFQTLWQRFMADVVKAGVPRFTFHDLRAKSLSDEETLAGAAERAAHADPRVTQRVYRRKPARVAPLKLDSPATQLDSGG
jgi:integrase